MGKQLRLKIPGYRYEKKASSVRLIHGHYHNPSGVRAYRCKGCHRPQRPKRLIRHHVQALELWSCEGCKGILIKV